MQRANEDNFRECIYLLVNQIPRGRVMTYGQIAALCCKPRAARIVGGVAHWGDTSLPWHRVVHKDGTLATGYPGGTEGHRKHLMEEGVNFINGKVDISKAVWWPEY